MNMRWTSASELPSVSDSSGWAMHHVTAVAVFGRHLLYPANLTLDPTKASRQICDRLLGDVHVRGPSSVYTYGGILSDTPVGI